MKVSPSYGPPPGTVFRCEDNSCVDSVVLCERKLHLTSTAKLMPRWPLQSPLSLAVIEIPLEDGVVMLSLHSHSMPLAQRLDAHDGTIRGYARDE